MELEVDRIHPDPLVKNRHTKEDVEKLANNIKAYRLINPIWVEPISRDQYKLRMGKKRWLAYKYLSRKTIPSYIVDPGTDEVFLCGLRLSENKMRTFDLITECQELANLHRQGKSTTVLGRDFGESQTNIRTKIDVGYFPENIIEQIKEGNPLSRGGGIERRNTWSLIAFKCILPLRTPKIALSKLQDGTNDSIPLDDLYDYAEIEKVVKKANNGEIELGEQLRAYVAERRFQLEEISRDNNLQNELDVRLNEITHIIEENFRKDAETFKAGFETEHLVKIEQLQEKLSEAIINAQKERDERAGLETSHAEAMRKMHQDLASAHNRELSKKEQMYSSQIQELQAQLREIKQEQDRSIKEAEGKIKKEYERKIAQIQDLADKNKTEAEKTKAVIAQVKEEFNQKLKEKEAGIREHYEADFKKRLASIEGLIAERDRWMSEVITLEEHLNEQAERVRNLKAEHQKTLQIKDKEIFEKDGKIANLFKQIAEVEVIASQKSKAQAEADARVKTEEYRKKLEAEYEEKKKALERYYARREQELKVKVNKTVDDAINHFMDVTNKMDASLRLLMVDLMPHLDDRNLDVIDVRLRWIEPKISEALRAIEELRGNTITIN